MASLDAIAAQRIVATAMPLPPVRVNRAPVPTLWAAVVAVPVRTFTRFAPECAPPPKAGAESLDALPWGIALARYRAMLRAEGSLSP